MVVDTATRILMPRMGDSVSEGTILEWHKSEGDHVSAEETLVEISTDKVDAEVPSPVSGTIVRIHVPEGETSCRQGRSLAEIAQGANGPTAVSTADRRWRTTDRRTRAQATAGKARRRPRRRRRRRPATKPPAGSNAIQRRARERRRDERAGGERGDGEQAVRRLAFRVKYAPVTVQRSRAPRANGASRPTAEGRGDECGRRSTSSRPRPANP